MAPDNAAGEIVIPHFDLELTSENYKEEFTPVVKRIRPAWKADNVVFEKLPNDVAHGLINTMVRCYSNGCPEDSIMIRIHKISPGTSFIDRKVEPTVLKYLGPRGCSPTILATFRTGFCYQYILGEVLTCRRMHEEPIWRAVSSEMAKIHTCQVECPPGLVKGTGVLNKWIANCWDTYPEKFEDPIQNERFQKELPPRETLEKEIQECWDHALSFDPDVVMCHNDTRAENIVWNPETGIAKFVDFEVVCYNYRASEIAAHFLRFGGSNPTDYTLIPGEDLQLKWIRNYLKEYFRLMRRQSDDVTDEEVRKLYIQVNKFILVLTVMGALGGIAWATSQTSQDTALDGLSMGIDSIQQYYKIKDRLLAMKMS